MLRSRSAIALVATVTVAACNASATPGTSPHPAPSDVKATVPPFFYDPPTEPPSVTVTGGLAAETLATGSSVESIHWSPDGKRLAVAIWSGTLGVGRVEVFPADGSKPLATYDGTAAAWLDDSTVAVSASNPDPGAIIVVHSLNGVPGVSLPRPRYGLLGDDHGLAAISDSDFGQAGPKISIVGAWSPVPADAVFGRWSEITMATPGRPSSWSADGRFLALAIDAEAASVADVAWDGSGDRGSGTGRVRLAAASQAPVRLSLMRVPSGRLVETPNLVWDGHVPWLFSPDGSLLVGGTEDGVTLVLDTTSGRIAKRLGSLEPDAWIPTGQLLLTRPNGTTVLWNPGNDSLTDTDLGTALVIIGPREGEVALFPTSPDSLAATVEVRMAGQVATLDLEYGASPWASSWAPDGSAFYLATATDDAQRLHSSLVRISLP